MINEIKYINSEINRNRLYNSFVRKIKRIIKSKYLFYLLSLSFFFAVALNIPLVADDYNYSLIIDSSDRITNIFDIINFVRYGCYHWGGARLVSYSLANICLLGNNHILFDIIYPIVNTLIIEEVVQLFDKKKLWMYYLFFALLLSHQVLVLNQALFWIVGWAIYGACLAPLLYVLKYVKASFNEDYSKCNSYLLLFVSFIGSLFVETISLIIICLSVICLIREVIHKQVNKKTIYLLIGSIIGCLIIFTAPGIFARSDAGSLANASFFQKIQFGWTRFIYCYFFMNQRIFVILALVIVAWLFIKCDKRKIFLSVLLLPIIIVSLIIIIKPSLLGPVVTECLTGEWSYYTCKAEDIFKSSLIVAYYIIVLLASIIYVCRVKNNFFIFFLYGAAICSNLCFITTTLACERTQFVSFILLTIITLYIMDDFLIKRMIIGILVIAIMLIAYQSIKYINAYAKEYQIYKYNDNLYRECAKTKQKEIHIKEHNYKYVFKSDLYFENQNMWIFDMFRRYYCLDDDVIILPE